MMDNVKILCEPQQGDCRVNVIMGTSSVMSSSSASTPRTSLTTGVPGPGDGDLSLCREFRLRLSVGIL